MNIQQLAESTETTLLTLEVEKDAAILIQIIFRRAESGGSDMPSTKTKHAFEVAGLAGIAMS